MTKEPLVPNLWNITDLFSKNIFSIPVYQRPYSWDTDNVKTLLDDIKTSFNSSDKQDGYYTGNLIIHDTEENINGLITKYYVIDGQQRITTFCLILLALYSICNSINPDDPTTLGIKNLLWKSVNTRSPEKEYKSLILNSIEKKAAGDLYDYAFDCPQKLLQFAENYCCDSDYEKRVIENFKYTFNDIQKEFDKSKIFDFADYLINYVNIISIKCKTNENKVFSIFESINSKGKPLSEIDKIKCYIFSELDKNSYKLYLNKWGELIIKTNDRLEEYILTYIRAYIYYFRQSIKIASFKLIVPDELSHFYGTTTNSDTLKAFIDDLTDKVDYFNLLDNPVAYKKFVHNRTKAIFFYKIFYENAYQHPRALFFRLFVETDKKLVTPKDADNIVIEITIFMLEYLTLGNHDSKDVITMFSDIMKDTFKTEKIDADTVISYIGDELMKNKINSELLKYNIKSFDAYNQKKVSVPLLALFESYDKSKNYISYDNAEVLTDKFSESFSLDHLLSQTPNADDNNFKYYCNGKDSDGVLVLKSGSDFPKMISPGMPYEEFKKQILHKIGNLRLYFQDKNSQKSNSAIVFKNYGPFHTYQNILDREEEIADMLTKEIFIIPKINYEKISKKSKKVVNTYPKMQELIDDGIINLGDKIYINRDPNNSIAKLVDYNKVEFKGKIMTLNQWGQLITNWSSINVYAYTCLLGETETLQDKREKLVKQDSSS